MTLPSGAAPKRRSKPGDAGHKGSTASSAGAGPPRSPPPRLLPDRPFPPYAYRPGHNPHPTRDPAGHGYGAAPAVPERPDPGNWQACPDYLFGIDLFNHGYYWEAHEVWEGLWVACGRAGLPASVFRGLINLAAAGFKARLGNARGMRANAGTALAIFKTIAKEPGLRDARYMGLDIRMLADYAAATAARHPETEAPEGDGAPLAFDLVLRPE